MRFIASLVTGLFIAGNLLAGNLFAAAAPGENYLITYRGAIDAEDRHEFRKLGILRREFHLIPAFAAEMTPEAAAELAKNPRVSSVELDRPVHAFAQQTPYGIGQIRAPQVWPQSTGTGIKVAVIDTGIDYNHPDLSRAYSGGYDFANNDADPMDDNSHGSHVAGIIAATNNGEGVVGVAHNASLFALKVLDDDGNGRTSDVVAAIQWAADHGMAVANLSLGSDNPSVAEEDAMEAAYNRGVLIVAASGNEDGNPISYPAAYPSVIAVGATDSHNNLASFSNIGAQQELVAPGVGVLSTVPPVGTSRSAIVNNLTTGATYSSWGIASSPVGDVSGDAYYCGLGNSNEFPSGITGYVAVIRRGVLKFHEKVRNARAAGAAAAVIANHDDPLINWTLDDPDLPLPPPSDFVPCGGIPQADGNTLIGSAAVKAQLSSRLRVRVSGASYASYSGTSMASPHVAGAAALLKKLKPNLTNDQVRGFLTATATDLGANGRDVRFGFGLVNAEAAAAAAIGGGGAPPVAPVNFTAILAGGSVRLAWNDVNGEDGYKAYRRDETSSSFGLLGTLGVGVTATSDAAIAAGKSYTYHVTAFDADGESAPTADVTVVVPAPPAVLADFTFAPLIPKPNDEVTFSDVSQGAVVTRNWNFGDGATSNLTAPKHRFIAAGAYVVTLTAGTGSANSTATKTVVVKTDTSAAAQFVTAAAHTRGASGTEWKTRLVAHNRSPSEVTNVAVDLLLSDVANVAPARRIVSLAPDETRVFDDVIAALFGSQFASVSGSLSFLGNADLATRTYATIFGQPGTFGQFIPALGAAELSTPASPASYLTMLRVSPDFRINVGGLTTGGDPGAFELQLFDAGGLSRGVATLPTAATSHSQYSLESLFPGLSAGTYHAAVRSISGAPAAAYASLVQQKTGDPVYIEAQTVASPFASVDPILVTAVGRGAGLNGTFFTSSLTVTSTSAAATTGLVVSFLANGADNTTPSQVLPLADLPAGGSVTLDDVLSQLGVASSSGALRVDWSNSDGRRPIVMTRTSTPSASTAGGSFGQGIKGVPLDQAGATRLRFFGIESSTAYRSNVIAVNLTAVPVTVRVAVRENGALLGSVDLPVLAPFSHYQNALTAILPALAGGEHGNLSVELTSATGAVAAVISTVDNDSDDPYAIFPVKG